MFLELCPAKNVVAGGGGLFSDFIIESMDIDFSWIFFKLSLQTIQILRMNNNENGFPQSPLHTNYQKSFDKNMK
jgi:hypothetical protein